MSESTHEMACMVGTKMILLEGHWTVGRTNKKSPSRIGAHTICTGTSAESRDLVSTWYSIIRRKSTHAKKLAIIISHARNLGSFSHARQHEESNRTTQSQGQSGDDDAYRYVAASIESVVFCMAMVGYVTLTF